MTTIPANSATDANKISALTTNRTGPDVSSRLNGGLTITAADLVNAPSMTTTNRVTAIIANVLAVKAVARFSIFEEIFQLGARAITSANRNAHGCVAATS